MCVKAHKVLDGVKAQVVDIAAYQKNIGRDEKHFYDYSYEEGNGNHNINIIRVTE